MIMRREGTIAGWVGTEGEGAAVTDDAIQDLINAAGPECPWWAPDDTVDRAQAQHTANRNTNAACEELQRGLDKLRADVDELRALLLECRRELDSAAEHRLEQSELEGL